MWEQETGRVGCQYVGARTAGSGISSPLPKAPRSRLPGGAYFGSIRQLLAVAHRSISNLPISHIGAYYAARSVTDGFHAGLLGFTLPAHDPQVGNRVPHRFRHLDIGRLQDGRHTDETILQLDQITAMLAFTGPLPNGSQEGHTLGPSGNC